MERRLFNEMKHQISMNQIHILHLTTKLEFSGTEIAIHNLAKYHPDKTTRITVCSLTKKVPYKERLENDGIRVICLGMPAENFWQVCYNASFYLWKLFNLFRLEKITILHIHSFLAGILGRISGFFAGVPIIIRHIHNTELDLPSRICVEKILGYFTNHYILVSQGVREYAKEKAGIRDEIASIVYYGIDIEAIDQAPTQPERIRKELSLKAEDIIIGFCGRLTLQKGVSFALHAMPLILKEIPSVKLLIVGNGPLLKQLIQTAISLEIQDKVIFAGERHDTWSIYPIMDIFILPSLWEGLGIVILESMARGKPVIASDIPGPNEVIEHGQTGFLVPVKNSEALAEKIIYLLRDRHLQTIFAQKGREKVIEQFRAQRMAEEIEGIYRELLEGLKPKKVL